MRKESKGALMTALSERGRSERQPLDQRIARVAFTADGLVAAIVQQRDSTREVDARGGWNAEALRRTLDRVVV